MNNMYPLQVPTLTQPLSQERFTGLDPVRSFDFALNVSAVFKLTFFQQ